MFATVKFAPSDIRRSIFGSDSSKLVDAAYGLYTDSQRVNLLGLVNDYTSEEEILEEVFDLTNNPSRQEEREERYGRFQSVSVGDIVEIRGVPYVCENFGWRKLNVPRLTAKSSATLVWAELE